MQFPIHGHGSIRDLDFRHYLGRRAPGSAAGGRPRHRRWWDIGSGTIDVFAFVDPDRWEAAWEVVRSKLADMEVLQRAVVARRLDDHDPVVVWPESYGGEFRYWEEPHNYLG